MAAAWRRRLKGAGWWAVLILAVLFIGGLCFALPIMEALHSRGAAAESWVVFPVITGGIVLAMAAYGWLAAAWRRPEASSRYEIGGHQRRLQRYQNRASRLQVAAALLAYYVPALFVTIRQQGTAGLEDYFRGHLLDGFGFVGFLAIGWQLVTRDIYQATVRLTQSSAVIAAAGAFVAGGTTAQILIFAFLSEVLFGWVWQYATSAQRHAADDTGATRKADDPFKWVVPPDGDSLQAGQQLRDGHCLGSSNGRYLLIMWKGQLAIWGADDTKPVWTTGTDGSGATYAALDNSGRLRLYGQDRVLVAWQSPVPGGNANVLRLEDDGVLAAYRPDGKKVWGTPPVPAEYAGFSFLFYRPLRSHLHLPRC